MKMKSLLILSLIFCSYTTYSQVTLNANGAGNTYELITSVLAPNENPIEAPDCNHSDFGRHIDEYFDTDLGKHVFRFYIHVSPDDDRCINTDRQRNEIKTYDQSPDNLLGIENETVEYKWKFKLDAGFQVSTNFTHLHQLKSVGGLYAGTPMYTLTARKSTPDRLELRYAEASSQTTLTQTDLAPFKGVWVEVTEIIKYGTNTNPDSGTYSITIKKVSDNTTLFSYSDNSIKNWQTDADFVRPKWGIYRSLLSAQDLRDEEVLYADFSITEISSLSIDGNESFVNKIKMIPNPSENEIKFIEAIPNSFDSISIFDTSGKSISNHENLIDNSLDISNLPSGLYLIVLKKDSKIISKHKMTIK